METIKTIKPLTKHQKRYVRIRRRKLMQRRRRRQGKKTKLTVYGDVSSVFGMAKTK